MTDTALPKKDCHGHYIIENIVFLSSTNSSLPNIHFTLEVWLCEPGLYSHDLHVRMVAEVCNFSSKGWIHWDFQGGKSLNRRRQDVGQPRKWHVTYILTFYSFLAFSVMMDQISKTLFTSGFEWLQFLENRDGKREKSSYLLPWFALLVLKKSMASFPTQGHNCLLKQ